MAIIDYYPFLWSIALVLWLLAGVNCYKAFALRKYIDNMLVAGLLLLHIAIFFTVGISFSLTLDAIRDFPGLVEEWRTAMRMFFPGVLPIMSFMVLNIFRWRFKRFLREPKKWSDLL